MPSKTPTPSIQYAFTQSPDIGQSIEILPGIRWLRLPLPFLLGHINLWLLEDNDHWTIVDTGLDTRATREHWAAVLQDDLKGQPVSRIVITHLHPDHVGCAGWLAEQCEAPVWMSREEYLLCRILASDTGKPAPQEAIRFYQSAGLSDGSMQRYKENFGSFGKYVSELPQSYHRLSEGMSIEAGEYSWRVIIGRGHSVEHVCLYCEKLNTLISGDQILPTISSNVSIWPTEPEANPLADWLESIARLREKLPADVLVLPAHGKPFRGAHLRLEQLANEHLEGLDQLREACRKPMRAIDTFPLLFKSEVNDGNLMMATGEAFAHLRFLQSKGELSTWMDKDGVRWFQMKR